MTRFCFGLIWQVKPSPIVGSFLDCAAGHGDESMTAEDFLDVVQNMLKITTADSHTLIVFTRSDQVLVHTPLLYHRKSIQQSSDNLSILMGYAQFGIPRFTNFNEIFTQYLFHNILQNTRVLLSNIENDFLLTGLVAKKGISYRYHAMCSTHIKPSICDHIIKCSLW
jgi:hypothetical protein